MLWQLTNFNSGLIACSCFAFQSDCTIDFIFPFQNVVDNYVGAENKNQTDTFQSQKMIFWRKMQNTDMYLITCCMILLGLFWNVNQTRSMHTIFAFCIASGAPWTHCRYKNRLGRGSACINNIPPILVSFYQYTKYDIRQLPFQYVTSKSLSSSQ